MSEAIMIALITSGAAVVSNWFLYRKGRNDERVERAARDKELQVRLDSIEKKVDEHNGYAKRFEEIGRSIAEIETTLKFLRDK